MRDDYRKKLRNLTINDLDDPNRSRVDANQGDKEFRKLMDFMVYNVRV